LACSSSFSTTMIHSFGLLMELQNSYVFLSKLLGLFSKECSVFSLISILSPSPDILSLVPVCWSGFQLYF
jgi:hypothetical protein